MKPVNSNVKNKNCGSPTTSDCVTVTVGSDCLPLCKDATVTDFLHLLDTKLCDLDNELDLSTLDLKCLCGTGALECCPAGWNLVQLSTGEYACQNQETGVISRKELIPCASTPCPSPLTLVSVLQLIINKLCP